MKLNQGSFLLAVVFLFLTGCASMPERLSASVPPQVQLVEGSKEQVYAAARQAFKRLDFNVTRSSPGQLEAASAIHSSETFGDSRQLVANLSIREVDPGKSEVELLLTEEVTSQSMGGSHRQPLRENGFFGLYFAMLQQVLQEQALGKPAEKN